MKCKHTKTPDFGGLPCIFETEWAEKKMETHRQIKCPNCGLYKIWVKKHD